MITTADPFDNAIGTIKDRGEYNEPASPFAVGAGHTSILTRHCTLSSFMMERQRIV